MKIGIITTHFYSIPSSNHSGDYFILGLVHCLVEMGHEVSLFAPIGTNCPSGANFFEIPCSNGSADIDPKYYEQFYFEKYYKQFHELDIIHDFSIDKYVAENMYKEGRRNVISSPLGGNWKHPNPAYNFVCLSLSMRDRALRGASDYEGTLTPNLDSNKYSAINNAHVVYAGINTNWYTPTYDKKDFFFMVGSLA